MIAFAVLFSVSALFSANAEAKEKDEYVFLVTITRADGSQELIYTDSYILSGTSTASSVWYGGDTMGSGEDFCDNHMNLAVKGDPGLYIKDGKYELLENVHRSWNIAWNDTLTIVGQKWGRQTTVTMQKCPFPLIRIVPDDQ